MTPLLAVEGLRKTFTVRRSLLGRPTEQIRAVDDVTFQLGTHETLGLVGDSGSGKSTTARLIVRLVEPDAGRVLLRGADLLAQSGRSLREARRHIQMVFQDPHASLDPGWTVGDIVSEPLQVHHSLTRRERLRRAAALIERVGLHATHLARYPQELSGGQRQRTAIARALALEPDVLICDEPVSALDISSRTQVLALLEELRSERGLAYLFISHDLAVVRHMSDRIAVMYLGRIVEHGPADEVYRRPRHPYTQALLAAVPAARPRGRHDRQRVVLAGEPPNPARPPTGCPFHPRCPVRLDICVTTKPALTALAGGVSVACHLHQHGAAGAGQPGHRERPADSRP